MEARKRSKRDDGCESESEGDSGSELDCNLSGVDDSDGSSDSNIDPNLEFQVEFVARSIETDDFHGIRRLLQQSFLKANIDLSDLTDVIISQSSLCGSSIKIITEEEMDGKEKAQEDDESEVYGITSFVALNLQQDHCFVQQLKDYLLSQCKLHSTDTESDFEELLQKKIGLLVNEKVLNLPEQISGLALRTLLGELNDAEHFSCEFVLIIARSHLDSSVDVGQKRKKKAVPLKKECVFDFYENEFMLKEALLSFSYPVSESDEMVMDLKPFRTVIILPYAKLAQAIVAFEKACVIVEPYLQKIASNCACA